MKGNTPVPGELGQARKQARLSAHHCVCRLAQRAGRVPDVIYRLEAGHDTTVVSLRSVHSVLKLQIRLESADRPSLAQVQTPIERLEDER